MGDQQQPVVAWSEGRGEYLVAWQDGRNRGDIYGRRVSAGGQLLGEEMDIWAGLNSEQQQPAVAANGRGEGYLVAWRQEVGGYRSIRGVLLDCYGRRLGDGEGLGGGTSEREWPALAYDPDRGRYLAVWADYRHQAEGPDVYGQLLRDYTVVIDYTYDPRQRLVGADYSTGVQFRIAQEEPIHPLMEPEKRKRLFGDG
jgi:hypothetical protein